MDPASRSMIKITLPSSFEERQPVRDIVDELMGKDPAKRFDFIQRSAAAVDEETLDA
jgi:topoisomerase-4 subunit B